MTGHRRRSFAPSTRRGLGATDPFLVEVGIGNGRVDDDARRPGAPRITDEAAATRALAGAGSARASNGTNAAEAGGAPLAQVGDDQREADLNGRTNEERA